MIIRLNRVARIGKDHTDLSFEECVTGGFVTKLTEFLEKDKTILMDKKIKYDVQLRHQPSGIDGDRFSVSQTQDTLLVTPLQLAVISRQIKIVNTILKHAEEQNFLRQVLEEKTTVEFSKPEDWYFIQDIILHGINVVHLAAKFCPDALMEIAKTLQKSGILKSSKDILEATDPFTYETPLHFAAKFPNQVSTEILLACGVNPDLKNQKGYTALHLAAKEGFDKTCKVLLDNGANPSIGGGLTKENVSKNLTPLHKASTQKVVHTMLDSDADPNAVIYLKDEKKETVLDVLLGRSPGAVNGILDYGIASNGHELESPGLQIIFDFEFFAKEGLSDPKQLETNLEDALLNVDEMAVPNKIINTNQRHLLKHPLSAAYLQIKWEKCKKSYYISFTKYLLLLFAIISLIFWQAIILRCSTETPKEDLLMNCDGELQLYKPPEGKVVFWPVLAKHFEQKVGSKPFTWAFFYAVSVGQFFIVMIWYYYGTYGAYQRLRNDNKSWKKVFRNYFLIKDNILAVARLISLSIYLIVLIADAKLTLHFGAITIVIAGMELFLKLGRLPTIGIFVYMALYVVKTVTIFVFVYSPILVSFSIAFYMLQPGQDSFTDPLKAYIRVTTYLIGKERQTFPCMNQDY